MKPTIIVLLIFMIHVFNDLLYSQWINRILPNQNFFDMVQQSNTYFDSLRTVLGDSVLSGEGSVYAEYQRFFNHWAPRLSNHGDFEKYHRALWTYWNNNTNATPSNVTWHEVGPMRDPSCWVSTCWASGIGPIEHISFFKNNPQFMLCCQTHGGIFYSTDGGSTWNKTGTDNSPQIPLSGMARVIFHPTNYKTWFASSGGGDNTASYIMYTGGIFRTMDEGVTWTKIADYTSLGSIWNIIWELKVDPFDGSTLYAATEMGLYKTTNANSSVPTWTQILNKKVYDIEFETQNSQVLYATVKDGSGWGLMISTNGGQTWNTIPNPPSSTASADFLTIEVSAGAPGILYCLIGNPYSYAYTCGNESEVWCFNTLTSTWQMLNSTSTTRTSFGGGYNFVVNQVNGLEVFIGCGPELKKMVKGGSSSIIYSTYFNSNSFHPDVEYVIFHPNLSNEVWIATHGGIYKSVDGGYTWEEKNNGLGVAEVLKMASSDSEASHILIGTYHDGSMHTISPYSINWNPNWHTVGGGDGQRPLIDHVNKAYMWISSQGGYWAFSQDTGYSFSSLGCIPFSCFSGWETEGVLNKIDPSIIYRGITVSGKAEIGRSFDRGGTNQQISNFANIYAAQYYYRPWKLYVPPNNKNYLLVHIIVQQTSSSWWEHHLWRTKNANDNPSNVVWEELPVPYDGWISDIAFDENNPDIVYLAYSSSINNSNSAIGSQMISRMDYTTPALISQHTCPTNLCSDLTFNLPNTGVGNDALVIEKGTNGGMYIGTDVGVFYTNHQLLANDPQPWKLYGTALPHVPINGLEINYVTNKIRSGLYGRGVWEADLYCPPDYDINIHSANYAQYNHQFNEAENNIYITTSGSSYVLNNFTARAGNEIVITPTANDEIVFDGTGKGTHLFIHPCNHPGNSFRQNITSKKSGDEFFTLPETINGGTMKRISGSDGKRCIVRMYPNPSDGHIHIDVKDNAIIEKILLKDLTGKTLLQKESNSSSETLDISHLSDGLYFVIVQTATGTYTEKLIVRHE